MCLLIKLFITGKSLDTESKLVDASGCGEKGNLKWLLPDNRVLFGVASSRQLDGVMTAVSSRHITLTFRAHDILFSLDYISRFKIPNGLALLLLLCLLFIQQQ